MALEKDTAASAPSSGVSTLTSFAFAARIKDLRGDLEKYNGRLTRPRQMTNGSYLVVIPASKADTDSDERTELVLTMKNLDAVPDLEFAQLQKDKKKEAVGSETSSGLGAAQSVRTKLESLTSQIRAKIKAIGTVEQVRKVFSQFDSNRNGIIDREEFLVGCRDLEIQITRKEITMLWPLWDTDSNGGLDVDEFLMIAQRGGHRRQSYLRMRDESDFACSIAIKTTRKERILKKSNLAEILAKVALGLRDSIRAKMISDDKTPQIMFEEFDADGGGTLDKNEFFEGLLKSGYEISEDELEILWPMIWDKKETDEPVTDEGEQEVCSVDFEKFISSERWDFIRMKERLVKKLPNDVDDLIDLLEKSWKVQTKKFKRRGSGSNTDGSGPRWGQKVVLPDGPRRPASRELVKQAMPIVSKKGSGTFTKPIRTDLSGFDLEHEKQKMLIAAVRRRQNYVRVNQEPEFVFHEQNPKPAMPDDHDIDFDLAAAYVLERGRRSSTQKWLESHVYANPKADQPWSRNSSAPERDPNESWGYDSPTERPFSCPPAPWMVQENHIPDRAASCPPNRATTKEDGGRQPTRPGRPAPSSEHNCKPKPKIGWQGSRSSSRGSSRGSSRISNQNSHNKSFQDNAFHANDQLLEVYDLPERSLILKSVSSVHSSKSKARRTLGRKRKGKGRGNKKVFLKADIQNNSSVISETNQKPRELTTEQKRTRAMSQLRAQQKRVRSKIAFADHYMRVGGVV